MKKILVALIGVFCATSLMVNAQDSKAGKRPLTEEQKTLLKQMVEKYDTNKDGKLDKQERAKISKEDREKMQKAGLANGKNNGKKKTVEEKKQVAPPAAPTTPATPATTN